MEFFVANYIFEFGTIFEQDDTDNDDFGITDSPVPPVVEVILGNFQFFQV